MKSHQNGWFFFLWSFGVLIFYFFKKNESLRKEWITHVVIIITGSYVSHVLNWFMNEESWLKLLFLNNLNDIILIKKLINWESSFYWVNKSILVLPKLINSFYFLFFIFYFLFFSTLVMFTVLEKIQGILRKINSM
jgi:hypothetical protein